MHLRCETALPASPFRLWWGRPRILAGVRIVFHVTAPLLDVGVYESGDARKQKKKLWCSLARVLPSECFTLVFVLVSPAG